MIDQLAFASIGELSTLLSNSEITAPQLVELYASRIERYSDSSKAFISLDIENARQIAEAISADSADQQLNGIPYACKDLFDVKGIATTAGSRVLGNNIAQQDAEAIARMNQAGGIFLGKNNLHEFSYGATGENVLYGTPSNPYDSTRLAGGSSSGSATAVSYGLCAAALGTDTGGSVRAPAALCGLVGFKPTLGRISTEGIVPYSWTLDHVGTLTRTANDTARLFKVLADTVKQPALPEWKDLTIGIPETFFFEHCDSEILDSVGRLMTFLRQLGTNMKSVPVPSMKYTRSVSLTVQMPEALSYHNRYLQQRGDLYSRDFRAGLALGQCLLAEQYIRAKRFIETYRRDMDTAFRDIDLLLTPATPSIAPKIGDVEVSVDGCIEPAGNAITRYTSFFNMTGHPAITFPCGVHSQGLPMAAQLVGKHYEDELLIETLSRIESTYDFGLPLPDVG